jgi:hypothetical protein
MACLGTKVVKKQVMQPGYPRYESDVSTNESARDAIFELIKEKIKWRLLMPTTGAQEVVVRKALRICPWRWREHLNSVTRRNPGEQQIRAVG